MKDVIHGWNMVARGGFTMSFVDGVPWGNVKIVQRIVPSNSYMRPKFGGEGETKEKSGYC